MHLQWKHNESNFKQPPKGVKVTRENRLQKPDFSGAFHTAHLNYSKILSSRVQLLSRGILQKSHSQRLRLYLLWKALFIRFNLQFLYKQWAF